MKYLTDNLKSKFIPMLLIPLAIGLSGCGSDSKKIIEDKIDEIKTEIDELAPSLSLIGDENITIFQNTEFVDPGAEAIDKVDGLITVTTTGTVDETTLGVYEIIYTATDIAGNEKTFTRTVTVVPAVLTGTAAGGAAIVGTVVVKGANGNAKSSLIEADGTYEVDVTGLTAPYRLRAEGTVGGKTYKLHSYAEEATVDGNVNITPFTDLIIANTAQQLAENFFDSNVDTSLDAAELDAQEDALQAKLQNVFDELGLDAAIDLLNSSFSADHSGVDAALDLISIETDENNIATITNLLDNSQITDDITQTDDNDAVITVEPGSIGVAVTDTVAIANLFEAFGNAFSDGLPKADDISGYFGDDFISEDESLAEFFSDILTDPSMIGISFISVSVNDLDSEAGTASVGFTVAFGEVIDPEPEQWFVAKDDTAGWQMLGDQLIVDLHDLNYHCNDYDAQDTNPGACGINTSFNDDDYSNNGTDGEPILSASVSVISGVDGSVKDMFYIGTTDYMEGHIYNEGQQEYTWDWREFGTSAGQIDPSIFSVGDTIEYNFYEANLDLSDPSDPDVVGDVLFTHTIPVSFTPQTVAKYPAATSTTISEMNDFSIDEDLTIAWILADGTQIDEVMVQVDDPQGGFVLSVWGELYNSTDTSYTVNSAMFDEELLGNDNFDPTGGYTVIVRIYATDIVTGQAHSVDYRITVDPYTTPEPLACGYESGWDDLADFELGAPINPNSFAEFNEVVTSCGGATTIAKTDIAGTTLSDDGETTTFNDDAMATKASPSTGQFVDGDEIIDFNWYIDTVGSITYLVIETDSQIDSDLPDNFWLRETRAITELTGTLGTDGAAYGMTIYAEQSNYSDDDRAVGSDAEIWNAGYSVSVTSQ